jgi:hypothetical protein
MKIERGEPACLASASTTKQPLIATDEILAWEERCDLAAQLRTSFGQRGQAMALNLDLRFIALHQGVLSTCSATNAATNRAINLVTNRAIKIPLPARKN